MKLQQMYKDAGYHKYQPGRKAKKGTISKNVATLGCLKLQGQGVLQRWIHLRTFPQATTEIWEGLSLLEHGPELHPQVVEDQQAVETEIGMSKEVPSWMSPGWLSSSWTSRPENEIEVGTVALMGVDVDMVKDRDGDEVEVEGMA